MNSKLGWIKARLLLLPLGILFVGWSIYVFKESIYSNNPSAWEAIKADAKYYPDIITRLPLNLHLLLALIFFLFSAIGPGNMLLKPVHLNWRDPLEETLFSLALGLIIFTFVTLVIGVLGLLNLGLLIPLLVLAFLSSLWYIFKVFRSLKNRIKQREQTFHSKWKIWIGLGLGLLLLFNLYIALLGALGPEINWDARYYHLGPPAHYALQERIYDPMKTTGLGAAALSPYQEILYTALVKLFGVIGAKLLHWGQAVLTVLTIIYFCRTYFGSILQGILAALIFINVPVVSWLSATGYNDLPLAFYGLLIVHAFLRWKAGNRTLNWLFLIGILGGYTLGIKTFGAFTLAIIIGTITLSILDLNKKPLNLKKVIYNLCPALGIIGLAVIIGALPWLTRSYAITGNPTYPFLNNIFKSPYWNSYVENFVSVIYQGYGTGRSFQDFLILPWSLVTQGIKFQTLIGPGFLIFLPIIVMLSAYLIIKKNPKNRLFFGLGIFCTLWMALWFISGAQVSRYAVPVLPIAAIAISFCALTFKWTGWEGRFFQVSLLVVLLAVTTLNSQLILPLQKYSEPGVTASKIQISWEYLYHGDPEENVQLRWIPLIRYINANLSPNTDKVYDAGGIVIPYYLYCKVEAFDGLSYMGPTGLQHWSIFQEDALQYLHDTNITHIAIYAAQYPALQLFPINQYLQQVYFNKEGTGELLFKINYPSDMLTATVSPKVVAIPEKYDIDTVAGVPLYPSAVQLNGSSSYTNPQNYYYSSSDPYDKVVRDLTLLLQQKGFKDIRSIPNYADFYTLVGTKDYITALIYVYSGDRMLGLKNGSGKEDAISRATWYLLKGYKNLYGAIKSQSYIQYQLYLKTYRYITPEG